MTPAELLAAFGLGETTSNGTVNYDMNPEINNPTVKARLAMGREAVLTVNQACMLLPLQSTRARKWLLKEKLISKVDGKDVVIWGAVLDRLSGVAVPMGDWKPKAGYSYPRSKL